jgi:hypothetical protein
MSLPKCLDNVIRFRIPQNQGSEEEVSITTEPKMLALPSSAFVNSMAQKMDRGRGTGVGKGKGKGKGMGMGMREEDGWEDGEDLGGEEGYGYGSEGDGDGDVETEEEEEDGGFWLEGRFQRYVIMYLR